MTDVPTSGLDLIKAEARAEAFDDAAAIVRRQHRHGGLNLSTEDDCLKASWTFSNAAYQVREWSGLKQPDDAEFHDGPMHRLRQLVLDEGDRILPAGHVQMPASMTEALAMMQMGQAYAYGQAVQFCIQHKTASPGRIQRGLNIGYNLAREFAEKMVKEGLATDDGGTFRWIDRP